MSFSVCVCMFLCVCTGVARTNEVFSRGGLCQSGEGGPTFPPCCHINSVPAGKREGKGEEGEREEREGQLAAVGKRG